MLVVSNSKGSFSPSEWLVSVPWIVSIPVYWESYISVLLATEFSTVLHECYEFLLMCQEYSKCGVISHVPSTEKEIGCLRQGLSCRPSRWWSNSVNRPHWIGHVSQILHESKKRCMEGRCCWVENGNRVGMALVYPFRVCWCVHNTCAATSYAVWRACSKNRIGELATSTHSLAHLQMEVECVAKNRTASYGMHTPTTRDNEWFLKCLKCMCVHTVNLSLQLDSIHSAKWERRCSGQPVRVQSIQREKQVYIVMNTTLHFFTYIVWHTWDHWELGCVYMCTILEILFLLV